jgi:signal transduction histidine kinase
VQPVAGPLPQVAETSATISQLALASAAAKSLARVFPTASIIVLRNYADEPVVKVVGGANIPTTWSKRVIRLENLPLVDEALRCPNRIVERFVRLAPPNERAERTKGECLQALCAAIDHGSGPRYALLFFAPPVRNEARVRIAALDTARRLLITILGAGAERRLQLIGAIHRAKREWEISVDVLPEIVGLLDRNLRVVRISRALERWKLGGVQGAIGRDLHAVLHPVCAAGDCPLETSLRCAAARLRDADDATFEFADPILARDFVVTLTRTAASSAGEGTRLLSRTALTVADVTLKRKAEQQLRALNQTLEARVAERTGKLLVTNRALHDEVARRRSAEHSLRRSMLDLEALTDRLMNSQEAERKRISQDLHDSVGQMLGAIKYSLERAQLLARRGAALEALPIVDVVVDRVQRLMDEVRAISMNLRPALLDHLGAVSAVRSLCRDWREVYQDVEVEIDIPVADADIPAILVTNVFRAVQESLNNVARHAAASHVQVSMRIEGGVFAVRVCDDGLGFDQNDAITASSATRGLRGLRERAEQTGGRFEVTSRPGKGTTVELAWPVSAGHAARLASARLN